MLKPNEAEVEKFDQMTTGLISQDPSMRVLILITAREVEPEEHGGGNCAIQSTIKLRDDMPKEAIIAIIESMLAKLKMGAEIPLSRVLN